MGMTGWEFNSEPAPKSAENRPEVPFEKDTCINFQFWMLWDTFGPFFTTVQGGASGQTLGFDDFVFWSSDMFPRCCVNSARFEVAQAEKGRQRKWSNQSPLNLGSDLMHHHVIL